MNYYFKLQKVRIERNLLEIGIHPIVGYVLVSVTFVLLSIFLFYRTIWAEYIYVVVAITFIAQFSAEQRNDFLKSCFKHKEYFQIRCLENSLIASPFLVFLLYKTHYWMALLLLIAVALLTKVNIDKKINLTIPTPFYKYPFEFITGFRRSFLFILFVYFLAFKAYQVDNFTLGAFSLGLLFLVSMSFYLKPENEYFVWIYAKSTKDFLIEKIVNALICVSFLTIPLLGALCIWKIDQIGILIAVQSVGYVFLTSMILAKYSAYPFEMNVPQAILFALSLWFPPLLLLVIPLFYSQSRKRLRPILE